MSNPDLHNIPDDLYAIARQCGELPQTPEKEPTLRGEIAEAIEMLALCDATACDIEWGRIDTTYGLALLLRRLDALYKQLLFIDQIAENKAGQ